MKGFLLTVVLVVALFFGIAVKHGDVQLPTIAPISLPSTPITAARQTAGHAFTPNQYNITSSIEWLWDQNGVYRLDPGSNMAHELLDDRSLPITQVQGLTYSLRGEALTDFYVWIWSAGAVFRYQPTGELVRVQDAAAHDIAGVQGLLVVPRPLNDDRVWFWTATQLYEVVEVSGRVQAQPLTPSVAGIQSAKVTPDARYVWLWNAANLFVYDLQQGQMVSILNSGNAGLNGIQHLLVQPGNASDVSQYTIWAWNELDLFRFPFPTTNWPPRPEKMVNDQGGGINQVQGVWFAQLPTGQPQTWVWTPWQLFQLQNNRALPVVLVAGDVAMAGVHGVTACPSAPYLYVWNAHHLFQIGLADGIARPMARPDGSNLFNGLRRVIACPTSATGAELWAWDSEGVYRQIGQGQQTRPVLTQLGNSLADVRGMMVGQYRQGQEVWLWSGMGVFQYQPAEDRMKEMVGPDGMSLANVWMVMMRPDKTEHERGYTVLLRHERGVFQFTAGNPRPVAVTSAGRPIVSPPPSTESLGLVVVGHDAFSAPLAWPQTTLNMMMQKDGSAAAIITAYATPR